MSKKGFLAGFNPDYQPNEFSFSSLTLVNVNTLYSSDIVQISGIRGACPISVTGSGTPQFRIGTTADMSTVIRDWSGVATTIKRGQYVQVRFTSSSNYTTGRTVNLTVGSITGSFTATTKPQPAVRNVTLSSIAASQYTLENDWNPSNNSIQAIGAGAHGGTTGGGGGAWVRKFNVPVNPGQTVAIQVGNPNANTDTWFVNNTTLLAKGAVGATGGQASASVGDEKNSGGNGSGSGGAAGSPSGPGGNGTSAQGGSAAGTSQGVGGLAGTTGTSGTQAACNLNNKTIPGSPGGTGGVGQNGTSGSQPFPSGGGGGRGGTGGPGGSARSCSGQLCASGPSYFCWTVNWTQPAGAQGAGGAAGHGGGFGGGGGARGSGSTLGAEGSGATGGLYLTWQPV